MYSCVSRCLYFRCFLVVFWGVLTMLAAETFDPRLIWDAMETADG